MLKYLPVSHQANATRQQAADIAENRTNRPAPNRLLPKFGAGHAKKHYLSSHTRF